MQRTVLSTSNVCTAYMSMVLIQISKQHVEMPKLDIEPDAMSVGSIRNTKL